MISAVFPLPLAQSQAQKVPEAYLPALEDISQLDKRLKERFANKFSVEPSLNRQLVSFQANKSRPVYRWYKYKEAFSAALVEHLLQKYEVTSGAILDPFAGSGTALFAASEMGITADGIELLPIGQKIITARQIIENEFSQSDVDELRNWVWQKPWKDSKKKIAIAELRITKNSYPEVSRREMEKYLAEIQNFPSKIQIILQFALLCVLETVSYTRKDGQYLRWDYRSGRRQGEHPFDKGEIPSFDNAITAKLEEIINDLTASSPQLDLFQQSNGYHAPIHLLDGSCLELMPGLNRDSYDAIVTSPPYCNRYDYTRTYALELALLGVDEAGLVRLRQEMLSCTVENRSKNLLSMNPDWVHAIAITDKQELLQSILKYLKDRGDAGDLNNDGIPRMVRGYFYEMACVISESHRLLKSGGLMLMVNDNVRYAGASVSVDMILSDIAEKIGFHIENILVLPNGKGNSSQQMGEHGREQLRKCVYIWRKC